MPRSNQTKRLLAQSLMDLMTTTPLEKISVNDIVDHAGVGRNTFYYHFEDKYDLVNWYFQSGVTQFLVERSAYASWNALLEAVDAALAAQPDVADKIRAGKVAAAGAIVGAVMKATRGQADAKRVRELIMERVQG